MPVQEILTYLRMGRQKITEGAMTWLHFNVDHNNYSHNVNLEYLISTEAADILNSHSAKYSTDLTSHQIYDEDFKVKVVFLQLTKYQRTLSVLTHFKN